MTTTEVTADSVLPLDGPYTPADVIAAAALTAELVRRLNNATRTRAAFASPPDLDCTLGHLNAALERLPQLFERAARLADFGNNPQLYSTAHPDAGDLYAAIINTRVDLYEAGAHARRAADRLSMALAITSTLGLREEVQQ